MEYQRLRRWRRRGMQTTARSEDSWRSPERRERGVLVGIEDEFVEVRGSPFMPHCPEMTFDSDLFAFRVRALVPGIDLQAGVRVAELEALVGLAIGGDTGLQERDHADDADILPIELLGVAEDLARNEIGGC